MKTKAYYVNIRKLFIMALLALLVFALRKDLALLNVITLGR